VFVETFRLLEPGRSVHFEDRDHHLPARSLCEQRFLVLEIEGHTVRDQHDLLGGIEVGICCPWFEGLPHHQLTPTYDGFHDVLGSLEEWLDVAGLVVCFWDPEDMWRRIYSKCGGLVESWLFVKETRLPDLPLHLVWISGPREPILASGGERLRPYKSVEAIRWMPPGALKPQ
jgi:hypothetical protein